MFKVNNKNTRPFSSVSIIDFEQVTVSWVNTIRILS